MNVRKFITGTVPKEALARGKPLEKPQLRSQIRSGSETQVPEGSRSTLKFAKLERDRSKQANKDVPCSEGRDR